MKQRRAFVGSLLVGVLALLSGIPALRAQQQPAPRIYLQSLAFDPRAAAPDVPAALRAVPLAQQAGLALIQFTGPVQEAWKIEAQQAGARLYGYVPDYAFVAQLDGAAQARIERLPFVRWIGSFHPAYKLHAALANAAAPTNARRTVTIQTLPDANLDTLAEQIQALNGVVLARSQNEWAAYLRAELASDRLADVARADGVLWIAPYVEPTTLNSVGGGTIMRANAVRQSLDLFGRGQTVAVADTGLDTGNLATLHPDIRGRVRSAVCLGRPQPCAWSDPHGHGTHVIGSVLGNGAASGSDPANHNYIGSQAGIAPEADLMVQSLLDHYGQLGGVPIDQGDLMRQAYRTGARVHTNSWGSQNGAGEYTPNSAQIDAAAWQNKDILVLFAAGNGGVDANNDGVVDPGSLYEQGVAKNVLTVGASESMQPNQPTTWNMAWPDRFKAAPISNDIMADDPNGVAAFSSRGPAGDGRIKPDVVAPGTYIVSTRSRDPQAGAGWGAYDNNYVYNSGTSMATPLVAGGAALTREWLARTYALTQPSAALVKGLLLNGAASMGVGQYGAGKPEIPPTRPNNVAGWGRVDLQQTLAPDAPRRTWFADNTLGVATGERATYTLSVGKHNAAPAAARMLLAWTDYPGQPLAARTLVNDLDLQVIAPDGSVYRGNQDVYAQGHRCLRDGSWDGCNNVEGVNISLAQPGTYTVTVRGINVPQGGRQPFALVATGNDVRITYKHAIFVPVAAE